MKLINTTLMSISLLGLSIHNATAALIHLSGDTVDFYYDPVDVDPLYGSINVSGDTIFALPTQFSTTASGGVIDTISAQGTIQVVAKDGYSLSSITVAEGGFYKIDNSASSVDVDAALRLFDFNDPLAGIGLGTEENINLTLSSGLNIKDGNLNSWSASGSFDMTTATWDGINHVGLSLTNLLTATSVDGGIAYIDKNSVGGVGFTFSTAVPVPAAVWLFGSGLIGLFGFARRKKS